MTTNAFPQATVKTDSSTILQGFVWVLYVKKVISSASNNARETKKTLYIFSSSSFVWILFYAIIDQLLHRNSCLNSLFSLFDISFSLTFSIISNVAFQMVWKWLQFYMLNQPLYIVQIMMVNYLNNNWGHYSLSPKS